METIRIRGKKDALVKNNTKYKPPKNQINIALYQLTYIYCALKKS